MTDTEVDVATRTRQHLYLLDADDEVDELLLQEWIEQRHPADRSDVFDVVRVPHPRSDTDESRLAIVAQALDGAGDVALCPLRVAWLAAEHDGDRTVRIRDLVRGDPRNPTVRRKRALVETDPSRAVVIAAESATLLEIAARPEAPAGDSLELARFVSRMAFLALERAEYQRRGARYKVPRLVKEDLTGSAAFRDRAAAFADSLERDRDEVWIDIDECLDEMVTGYSRLFLDLMARIGKRVKRPGYGDEIDYDPVQLERLRETLATRPAVILPSHKSNLDATVIPVVLHENGFPPTHTFAGINMAFWPFGLIFRRAGRIFIRRDIRDDPVYRWVLREYLGYLVENRFNLEWYVEGTRSRTGKLAPPKLGLLRYIADACREGRTDDVAMVPVSIMYDQLNEVKEFAAEGAGRAKKAETIGWALKFIRSQRGQYGRIYVRFAEPISLRAAIEGDAPSDSIDGEMSDDDIRLQKLAFEVSTRINSVTPITGSALVCTVLLAVRGRALTAAELHRGVGRLLDDIRLRRLPLAASAESLTTVDGVTAIARSLAANDIVDVYDSGDQPVYQVDDEHHLAAAFYRNTIVHFFVTAAIAEVAIIHAGEHPEPSERVDAFWAEALRLRDLLKFDFFFEQRDRFIESLTSELDLRADGWAAQLAAGSDTGAMLDRMGASHAFGVLRPFVEAYLIVAAALVDEPTDSTVDAKAFKKRCLAKGGQWVRQKRVRTPEAVSQYLFEPAIKLADHRGLLASGPEVAALRRDYFDELVDVARRIDVVEERVYTAAGQSLTVVPW